LAVGTGPQNRRFQVRVLAAPLSPALSRSRWPAATRSVWHSSSRSRRPACSAAGSGRSAARIDARRSTAAGSNRCPRRHS